MLPTRSARPASRFAIPAVAALRPIAPLVAAACLALLTAGCGIVPVGATGHCTITLTGAVNDTLSCNAVIAATTDVQGNTNSTSVTFVAYKGGVLPSQEFSGNFLVGTDFAARVYDTGNTAKEEMIINTGALPTWRSGFKNPDDSNHPTQGTFVMHISDAGSRVAVGSSYGFQHVKGNVTGTADAVPMTGATGTINIQITFDDSQAVSGGVTDTPDGGTPVPDGNTVPDGTSSMDGGGGGGGGGGCTVTFSGPVSTAIHCTAIALRSGGSSNLTIVSDGTLVDPNGTNLKATFSGTVMLTGDPVANLDYTAAGNVTGASAAALVQVPAIASWALGTSPPVGSFTLRFSNVGAATAAGMIFTSAHGTLNATLKSGGSGADLTATVAF